MDDHTTDTTADTDELSAVPAEKPLPEQAQRDLAHLTEHFGREYAVHVFWHQGELVWTAVYRLAGEHDAFLDKPTAGELKAALREDYARRAEGRWRM